MSINLSIAARNAANAAVTKLIDGGTGQPTGKIEIRTGTKPANPDSPVTGTLLSTIKFSNPAFGTPLNGGNAANTLAPDSSIAASGTAGWFRCYDRDGRAILDGDVGAVGSAADIQFDDLNLLAGGTVAIGQFTLTVPPSC